ncbi:hypothetical protein B296_00019155 [Ensete ventricosum]|uniref:Uncharacterized protein n=1 Tax=Ensete ventricosum TaxID=4639 RepID=A0A426YMJ0_ENSVE|nr:hypothetical protein B296_00019155 [Ensete ventricosum]
MEPNHPPQTEEVITLVPTPNCFWRMMIDPGFSLSVANPALSVVTLEAFLGLTNQSRCHSRDSAQASLDLDTLSSDSTDSLREQVYQVHQRLDKVQKKVLKSKEEFRESSKGGSLFTPEIQDKPLPTNFRLPSLKLYDGNYDSTEHVVTFHAQMLYMTRPTR